MKPQIRELLSRPSWNPEDIVTAPTPKCKMCHQDTLKIGGVDFNKSCNAYPLPRTNILVEYYMCETCDFFFTDFFDDWSHSEFSQFIYNDDYIKVDPDYTGSRALLTADSLLHNLEPARGHVNILDYGGGEGLFAAQLRSYGFDATSYDPFAQPEHPDNGPFDIVTAFEVIEHDVRPKNIFAALLGQMKEDGCLIIGQSMLPEDIRDIGCTWWYVAPRNGHVSFYSHRTMEYYARERGLVYRNVHGLFVLHRPAVSEAVRSVLDTMAPGISVTLLSAPGAAEGGGLSWHDYEEGAGGAFRWSGSAILNFGAQWLQAGTNIIELPYLMAVQDDFARGCRLQMGDMDLPMERKGSALRATIVLEEARVAEILVQTPQPRIPAVLGLNPDQRPLGLAVRCL